MIAKPLGKRDHLGFRRRRVCPAGAGYDDAAFVDYLYDSRCTQRLVSAWCSATLALSAAMQYVPAWALEVGSTPRAKIVRNSTNHCAFCSAPCRSTERRLRPVDIDSHAAMRCSALELRPSTEHAEQSLSSAPLLPGAWTSPAHAHEMIAQSRGFSMPKTANSRRLCVVPSYRVYWEPDISLSPRRQRSTVCGDNS